MRPRFVLSWIGILVLLSTLITTSPSSSYATPPPNDLVSVLYPDDTLIPAPGYQPAQIPPEYTANRPVVQPGATHASDEVIIRFRPNVSIEQQNTLMAAHNMRFGRPIYGETAFVAKVPVGAAQAVANALRGNPLLEIAGVNAVMRLYHQEANDTYRPIQTHLDTINAGGTTGGWQYGHSIRNVTVVSIIDTGVDAGGLDGLIHPDIVDKFRDDRWHSFVSPFRRRTDSVGHGTHVAGLAAPVTNNQLGVAGVGYGASPMSVQAMDLDENCSGSGFMSDVTSAVNWSWTRGASVINMSLGCTRGYPGCNPDNPNDTIHALKSAVDAAHARGVTVIAAAGNTGSTTPNYPAAFGQVSYDPWPINDMLVLAVSGSWTNQRHPTSSYGDWIDFAAPFAEDADPNQGLWSLMPTDGSEPGCSRPTYYGRLRGTSMAAPQVSGLSALIVPLGYSAKDIYTKIKDGATDLPPSGYDIHTGWGRINVGGSMQLSVRSTNAGIVVVPNAGYRAQTWFNVQGSGFTSGSIVRFCITAPGYEDDCQYTWTVDHHGVAGIAFQPSATSPVGKWYVYAYDTTGRWTPQISFEVLPPNE